jgi:hypothetical protein
MTGVEMYVDVKKHSDPDNTTPFPVHKILACSIFCLVNVLIFGHMLYLVLYALRVSVNYVKVYTQLLFLGFKVYMVRQL